MNFVEENVVLLCGIIMQLPKFSKVVETVPGTSTRSDVCEPQGPVDNVHQKPRFFSCSSIFKKMLAIQQPFVEYLLGIRCHDRVTKKTKSSQSKKALILC